jgi:sialate O-acetylesterase
MRQGLVWLLSATFMLASYSAAMAEVTLPKIFGNHMVLQAERTVPVWGKASPNEKVKVTLGDSTAEATAGENGKWEVKLATPKAGGPFKLIVEGTNKIELDDVLIGEVWVCSGQSNMEWTVQQSLNADEEAKKANFPQIRMFKVQHNAAKDPQEDCVGTWVVCSPEVVKGFSAVGYFYARNLHEELNVPMGMISTNWGGTICEAWTSRPTLESDAEYAEILNRAKEFKMGNPNQASVLYNGMIHPIQTYGMRGAIWYQGESNLSRAEQYGKLFPAMITDWRKLWKQGDFPFYFAQIAPYAYNKMADTKQLPELWESQVKTLETTNTGMAATTDIGDVKDIHPKNKQEVGRRLALIALANTYGKKEVIYSGPMYTSQAVEGNKIRIKFKHTAGGLMTKEDKPVSHLQICGADKKFVDAVGTIDGETLLVSAAGVEQPVAVRFGWGDTAEPNLYNKAGLPACPFRSDSEPRITAGKK